jgi:RNA polymerase sigma-70 factor (ECF subfamily)
MSIETPFALVIERLRGGDPDAASEIFDRFLRPLTALAYRQFDPRTRVKADPDDVVMSVYKSFFVRDFQRPFDLTDWDCLGRLLRKITVRKCKDKRNFWKAMRRRIASEVSFDEVPGYEGPVPTPEQEVVARETLNRTLDRFSPAHRAIVALAVESYNCRQISERCGCSERTVLRVVERFKQVYQDEMLGPEPRQSA